MNTNVRFGDYIPDSFTFFFFFFQTILQSRKTIYFPVYICASWALGSSTDFFC